MRVASALRNELRRLGGDGNVKDASLFVMADTAYGSCCVDEVGASHVGADCVVHYGHACLSPLVLINFFWILFGFVYGKCDDSKIL